MPARLDPHQLHHGPFNPPALRRGDKATCLFRDADVVITGWSDGRISWPRCRYVDVRGGYGLLVDEELARAVRLESSPAIQRWRAGLPSGPGRQNAEALGGAEKVIIFGISGLQEENERLG